ncbi:MAG: DNA cytosine methyltransferase [Bacteroidia bacterium]
MNKHLDITPPLYTSIDVFCGGGGASLGIHKAGFTSKLGIDIDTQALKCYKANNPGIPVLQKAVQYVTAQEIFKITGLKRGELGHLHGSPPCKLYSTANTKAASNPPENANANFHELIELIYELRPLTWTAENVNGMLEGAKTPFFNDIIRRLHGLNDYEFKYKVMNCSYYGVPQDRLRVIFIGKRKDVAPNIRISFPKPNKEGTRFLTIGEVAPHIDRFDPKQFDAKPKDNSNLMCTITATDGLVVYAGGKWRGLTIPELKLFMGFPKSFVMPCKARTTSVRILGNAVPPPLMTAVMQHIKTQYLI